MAIPPRLSRPLARACSLLLLAAGAMGQAPDLYDPDTIRDLWLVFPQAGFWQQLVANRASETPIAADLTVDGVTLHGVGVRFRGNTSFSLLPATSQKASFNLDVDWLVEGQELLGYRQLNLNNGWHDPTFLREFLGYLVMRQHGLAPKCNFVRLHLNGAPWGLYVNVQQPNKDLMKPAFGNGDGSRYRGFPSSGGFDNGRCAMTWLGADPAFYLAAYQAKRGDGADLAQLCYVLGNTPPAGLSAALPAWLDVDGFLRYAAVMNVLANADSYAGSGKEHWLYRDVHHGAFHVLPFDLNEVLNSGATMDPWAGTASAARPALSGPLQVPEWRERYRAHLRHVLDTSFEPGSLVQLIQYHHARIAADVAADGKKLYSTAAFQANLTSPITIDSGYGPIVMPGLVPFVQARAAFLAAHPDLTLARPTLSSLAHVPALPDPTQHVVVRVDASTNAALAALFWRAQGPYQRTPMFDDGLHGDGGASDGRWGAIVPSQPPGSRIDYYVEAATASGQRAFLPANAEWGAGHFDVSWPHAAFPVCIDEFVAQNQNGIQDEMGQHEDWLELFNTATVPIDVGGLWLSDDASRPKYQIPANTWIGPLGSLLVWCDDDPPQGQLHATFRLSANGEAVALFAADGLSVYDVFEFGPQTADVSTGRLRDGDGPWVTFRTPTPRAGNGLGSCGTLAFGALAAGTHTAALQLVGPPRIGTSPTLQVTAGPAAGLCAIVLALEPAHLGLAPFGLPGEVLLLDPTSLALHATIPLDAQGQATAPWNIPAGPWLIGVQLAAQALTLGPAAVDTSHALLVRVCP